MRILQIHNRYREPGGEDTVVAAEAALLRSAGFDVRQYAVENSQQALRAAGALALAPWNPVAGRRVKRIAASLEPDVAHVHNTWYSLSPSVFDALRSVGVPVVVTLHNYRLACVNAQLFRDGEPCQLCVGTNPWHGVRYRCYRDSAAASTMGALTIALNRAFGGWHRSVTTFLALTEFAKRTMIAAGLPEQAIRVKPNFVPDPGARQDPPSKSGEVLFVGRLSAEKGLRPALEAWRRAAPDLDLVVIGDGPERTALEAAGVPRVRFLGRVDRDTVRRRMLTSRALLFPSLWYEGQPMVVLEAFAAGLPVLGSDLGGTAELLEVTPDWRVTAGNESWERSFSLLEDGRAVDEAGDAVRQSYEERFTPDRAADLLREIYEDARSSA